jgi:hypothetical protein
MAPCYRKNVRQAVLKNPRSHLLRYNINIVLRTLTESSCKLIIKSSTISLDGSDWGKSVHVRENQIGNRQQKKQQKNAVHQFFFPMQASFELQLK